MTEADEKRAKANAAARARRAAETPEQRERRLAPMRQRARSRLAAESPEERTKRLEYLRAYGKEHKRKNEARLKAVNRVWYEKNKARILELGRRYRQRNKAALMERLAKRRSEDSGFAIASRIRHRVYLAVRSAGAAKHARTMELVGCSREHLIAWIEGQFVDGMSWSNRSQWHIDHIIPCSAFNLHDEGQQRIAFHYTNMRPVWAADNLAKKDRIPIQARERWTLACVAEARRAVGADGPDHSAAS
jgi:hypothetical protein